ncbi:MAG: hypothetical protein L6Q97_22360 [Thermoanaerobaculia bacterium]|nr:hypothetical protein [Thermoanaerobaculia bacterium]
MLLKSAERLVFYFLLALCLLPLWSVRYFLTIDGPCHLYNAKVLADFSASAGLRDFYESWVYLNLRFEPNWFSHFWMKTGFAAGIPAFLNEKLLQTFYLLAFGLGLRFVIRQLAPAGLFLSSLGLLFAYHHVFQMGFYNYSCSLALMFWTFGYWLRFQEAWTVGRQTGLAALFLALFFCHPVGLLFAFLLIGCALLAQTFRAGSWAERQQYFRQQSIVLALTALPTLVLFAEYLYAKGLSFRKSGDAGWQMWSELVRLTSLCTMMEAERKWTPLVTLLFLVLLGAAVWIKIRSRRLVWTDALFGAFILSLFIYFKQPGSFAGAGIMPIRLQMLPYLVLLLWLATLDFPRWAQNAVLACAVAFSALFWSIRLPAHWRASGAVSEYVSCAAAIPDKVSVLPLSFNHNGQLPDGQTVSTAMWLFVHAAGYIGAEKSIVLLDNYEAHTQNFPLLWREQRDPYVFLPKDGIGFEGQPPRAEFLNYKAKTNNANVGYVLTWCLDKQFNDHLFTKEIKEQLEQGYELVFQSENGLGRVYRKK